MVEDETERPFTPGLTHEWMEEEFWAEPDYVMEINVCDVESQAECVNHDLGLMCSGIHCRQWIPLHVRFVD